MGYKHVSELNYSEMSILFNLRDDILEQAIVELVNSDNNKDKIEHFEIREKFKNILQSKDIVINTETYDMYEKVD